MAEITVMGGGIFGLALAFTCLERGARVRLIEKRRIGAGSSGGVLGALAPHVPERWNEKKQFQLESLLMASDFWHRAEALSGRSSGYGRTGRLQPVNDEHGLDLARARAGEAARHWRGAARWEVVRRESLGDWAPQSATGWVIHDTLSARLNPRAALAVLAGAIEALGGEIVQGGAPPEDGGAVVWATGHEGLVALSQDLGRRIGDGVKGQAALLRPEGMPGDRPQIFVGGVHIVPHANGCVAVGSTSERVFDDPDQCDERLEELIARARGAVPALCGAPVIERRAGVRPRVASRAPLLGPWPGRAGHFVMNGGFKIGFGMAPKLAGVMADLVLEGRDGIPAEFRLEAALAKVRPEDPPANTL